jgi:hypothetical protein
MTLDGYYSEELNYPTKLKWVVGIVRYHLGDKAIEVRR